jgi:hypothetical protein
MKKDDGEVEMVTHAEQRGMDPNAQHFATGAQRALIQPMP